MCCSTCQKIVRSFKTPSFIVRSRLRKYVFRTLKLNHSTVIILKSSPPVWQLTLIDLPSSDWYSVLGGWGVQTYLVAQREVLAVLVSQSLGLLVVFGELHRSLTALGQQRPMGQERLLLPCRHVDAIGENILLRSKQRQRHHRPELSLLTLYNFKVPTKHLRTPQSKQPLLLFECISV